MANRAQRKFKHAKRVHHQKTTRKQMVAGIDVGKSDVVIRMEEISGKPLAPYQERIVDAVMEQAEKTGSPNRATCPACGKSQKVTKTGLIGGHRSGYGKCVGSGAEA